MPHLLKEKGFILRMVPQMAPTMVFGLSQVSPIRAQRTTVLSMTGLLTATCSSLCRLGRAAAAFYRWTLICKSTEVLDVAYNLTVLVVFQIIVLLDRLNRSILLLHFV